MTAISRDVAMGAATETRDTPFRRLVVSFLASRLAVAGLIVLAMIGLLALLAPWIAPQDPYDLARLDLLEGRLPPLSRSVAGHVYWLGTESTSAWLLTSSDGYILYDTAYVHDAEDVLVGGMQKLGLDPTSAARTLWLTTHPKRDGDLSRSRS